MPYTKEPEAQWFFFLFICGMGYPSNISKAGIFFPGRKTFKNYKYSIIKYYTKII